MEYMVFLIAEIGVNWDGDFELARQMMQNAKAIGCDAVKFQAFQESMVKDHPQHYRLINCSIQPSNVETINEIAKSLDIEWFCTPMYPEAVNFLSPFVKRFKIREKDGRPLLENKSSELLDRVMDTNKEIIISSQTTPRKSTYYKKRNIKWLYCVPKYPCELADLDFRNIKDYDGYSNHCPQLIAPLTASILGAKIIEIHITADKSKNFIDNNVSFDYNELGEVVRLIHLSEKIVL